MKKREADRIVAGDNNNNNKQKHNKRSAIKATLATSGTNGNSESDKQQQQQKRLLRNNNNNNTEDDIEANEQNGKSASTETARQGFFLNNKQQNQDEDATMTYCFKGKWIVLLSMSITLIITAILVAILTIDLLDNQDQCHQNFPFQQPTYKLFSTKTTYSSAYSFLNSQSDQTTTHHRSQLPQIFSKSDSLKTIHQRLTGEDSSDGLNCKVRQFHYFGRHAARFPSAKGIEEINKLLFNVQNRIDLSRFSSPNTNTNNNNNNTGSNKSGNATNVCFNPLAPYKQWSSFMVPQQGNLIMDSGLDETSDIAQRFKSIYPDMFNSSKTKIDIGTTEELRTAQTALVFLRQFDDFNFDFCTLDQFPTENLSDRTKAEELSSNECFKLLVKKYNKEKLQLHKRCHSLHKEDFTIPYNLNLKEPNRTKFIANSVSKKLKLAKDDYLTSDETEALYKICKYESALGGSSIWCNLFSDNDLKFYEYLNDIDDFFNQAYGHPDQMRSACPVTTELMKAFKTAKQQLEFQPNKQFQPEAHFYFTHSEVIQKILAASVDLEQDPEYSPKNILNHLNVGTSPKMRQWRTSLFTPFSANLAFTLYECPRQNKFPQNTPTGDNGGETAGEYTDIDVGQSPFKVVASLNERPIQLDGCSSYVCDLNALMTDSRIDREKRCKLEDICRKNIVVS